MVCSLHLDCFLTPVRMKVKQTVWEGQDSADSRSGYGYSQDTKKEKCLLWTQCLALIVFDQKAKCALAAWIVANCCELSKIRFPFACLTSAFTARRGLTGHGNGAPMWNCATKQQARRPKVWTSGATQVWFCPQPPLIWDCLSCRPVEGNQWVIFNYISYVSAHIVKDAFISLGCFSEISTSSA